MSDASTDAATTDTARDALQAEYQTLINQTLPSTYTQPIRFNHCFGRVVLDWLFDDVWYGHVDRPAYRHLTAEQLSRCIDRMHQWIADHSVLVADNARSLQLRGKA